MFNRSTFPSHQQTGTIDMDMITTGRTSADRIAASHLEQEVARYMQGQSGTVPMTRLLDDLNQTSDDIIEHGMLNDALNSLHGEGTIQYNPARGTVRMGGF